MIRYELTNNHASQTKHDRNPLLNRRSRPEEQEMQVVTGNASLTELLATHFPEVYERIDPANLGKSHLEIGMLRRSTQDAIKNGDWYTVRRHYNFIEELHRVADMNLQRAINISYLGSLILMETTENSLKARSMMPAGLMFEG